MTVKRLLFGVRSSKQSLHICMLTVASKEVSLLYVHFQATLICIPLLPHILSHTGTKRASLVWAFLLSFQLFSSWKYFPLITENSLLYMFSHDTPKFTFLF